MTYQILFVVAFIQNMAFTWVSRSRNSGNPSKHAIAAVFSNSIWFVCNFFVLFPEIMKTVAEGDTKEKLVLLLIYVTATTFGSVVMMKVNLGHWRVPFLSEDGTSKVGSR